MTWISLVCLLALSSAAFGRSVPVFENNYGGQSVSEPVMPNIITRELPSQQGYGGERSISPPEMISEPRPSVGYGSTFVPQPITRTLPVQGYGSSRMLNNYGSQTTRVLEVFETQADILCRNQLAGTVIPIENNRGFVTCLEPGKGVEQFCPKNLWYHETSRRCERTLGPLPDPCASQQCHNGGQCVSLDSSSWECRCAPGFEGTVCELDASFCQSNQPCGPGGICQSFRLGAALNHICIFEDGQSYGLSSSVRDFNPCKNLDGPQKLTVSDGGFLICDGGMMHIFACPGGTIWDDFNKACSWPDKPTVPEGGSYGYGGQVVSPPAPKTLPTSYGYGGQITLPPPPPPAPKTLPTSYGYGSQITLPPPPPPAPKTLPTSYGYGSQITLPPPPPPAPKTLPTSYGYGSQITLPPPTPKVLPRVASYGYGSRLISPPVTRTFTGYGGGDVIETPRVFEPKEIKLSSY